ncbi:MAG: hypothetical protein P0S95_02130 [Rhabdochlamydiaceae bacterium]|nr:hypothetical protein [Candidatus Amphrikana amoebophyrae]
MTGIHKPTLAPNPAPGFDNPNIQKETQKAMYGPGGNSEGKAAFMNASALENLLKSSGIPLKGKPFQLFYFYIKDVFMGRDVKAEEQNINKFAKQLTDLTSYFNEWENIKSQFFAAGSGTDTSKAFRAAVGTFLNSIFGRLGFHFATNGNPIDSLNFEGAIQSIGDLSVYGLQVKYPVLGENVVSIVNCLKPLEGYFGENYNNGIPPKSLIDFWNSANGGGQAIPSGGNLPNPEIISPVINALSEGASSLSGISSSNASKLQFAQNEYNRLNSFIHNMLSAWLNIRKGLNSKMTQARN